MWKLWRKKLLTCTQLKNSAIASNPASLRVGAKIGLRRIYNNASYLEFHKRNWNWEVWDTLDVWELPVTQSLQSLNDH